MDLKSWVLLIIHGKLRAKKGEGALNPPLKITLRFGTSNVVLHKYPPPLSTPYSHFISQLHHCCFYQLISCIQIQRDDYIRIIYNYSEGHDEKYMKLFSNLRRYPELLLFFSLVQCMYFKWQFKYLHIKYILNGTLIINL